MKILICDDHLLFREGLRRLLEQLGERSEFVEASTFDEAAAYSRKGEPFDLILLDLQMPGWPGFSGLQAIRDALPKSPVVVVSASESASDIRGALSHGASGYIPKSSSVAVMLSALKLVFSGGVYVPPILLQSQTPISANDDASSNGHLNSNGTERVNPHALTQRQWEVLNYLREGKSNKQIAYELGLSEGTVKIHVTAIFKSLGVKNRTQAVIASSEYDHR